MKKDTRVDLGALARPAVDPRSVRPRRRHWSWLVVPVAILIGFGALFATNVRAWLEGALPVEIVRPTPLQGAARPSAGAPSGTVATQAAGWVEPDPFPARAAALAGGVVRELRVIESDVVVRGQVLAQLHHEDTLLVVERAKAQEQVAQASVLAAESEHQAARRTYDEAVEATRDRDVAQAELESKQAEARALAQAFEAARAMLAAAESEVAVQRHLTESGTAGPRALELAEAELERFRAELERARAEADVARAEERAGEARARAARRALELRIEDRARAERAKAELERAKAELALARSELGQAELRHERMTVVAPIDGVVLRRLATTGTGLPADGSGAVVELYDPKSLRLRVEVPQPEIAHVFVGQSVQVESNARPGQPYRGEVLRLVQWADIARATVQVHVRVLDPDEWLRPEMVVQARFLAGEPSAVGESPGDVAASGSAGAVAIPARLVLPGDKVWVVDAQGRRARQRQLRLGPRQGELVIVLEGLNLSDKLIGSHAEHLSEGQSVRDRAGK